LDNPNCSSISKLQLPKSLLTFKPKKAIKYRRVQRCSLLLDAEAEAVKDGDDVMDSDGMPLLIHGDDVPSKNSKSSAKSGRDMAMTSADIILSGHGTLVRNKVSHHKDPEKAVQHAQSLSR
jgi:hypothetical protein